MQPLEITIRGTTADEVRAKYIEMGRTLGLSVTDGNGASAAGVSDPGAAAATEPAAGKGKAKSKSADTAKESTKEKESAPVANIFETAPTPAKKALTRDDVMPYLSDVNSLCGTDEAIALLKKYGATNLGTLKVEDYENFIEDAKPLIAAGKAAKEKK